MRRRSTTDAASRPKFQAGAELRARVVEAAAHLFSTSGYEQVSLRRIAEEVGCSPMAMYRHFPDKDALIRHVCDELYARFTIRMHTRLARIADAGARLEELACQFVDFALRHPNHYRLTFVTPPPVDAAPAQAAVPPDEFLRGILRELLPEATDADIAARVNQVIVCLHGMTIMLLAPHRASMLRREEALAQLRVLVRQVYTRPLERTRRVR